MPGISVHHDHGGALARHVDLLREAIERDLGAA